MLYSEADYSRAYYVGLQTRAVPPATIRSDLGTLHVRCSGGGSGGGCWLWWWEGARWGKDGEVV